MSLTIIFAATLCISQFRRRDEWKRKNKSQSKKYQNRNVARPYNCNGLRPTGRVPGTSRMWGCRLAIAPEPGSGRKDFEV